MAHVLIGFAEALPAAEVLFSLRSAGHRVSIFTCNRQGPMKSLHPEQVFVLPDPQRNASAARDALKKVMDAPDAPDLILPLDDAALWLVEATLGQDSRSAGATGQQARIALDKFLQIEAAKTAGLAVPPTLYIKWPADLKDCTTFPAIAKPALAVRERKGKLGKGAAVYLLNANDTAALAVTLKEQMEPMLVQPLIAGRGEGIFGYATQDGVVAWSGHERLRMMNPHGSGSSACISLMPEPSLRKKVAEFISIIGWQGPFMIELLRDKDGTAWFMELNGRMWGSLALARRQGLEYPAWAVAGALDPAFRPIVPLPPAHPLILRNLGRDLLHLLFVLRGPKNAFYRKNWPRFLYSLAGVFRPTHIRNYYNYDPSHRSFFLRDALWTLRKAFRR